MTIILTSCTNRKKGIVDFNLTSNSLDSDFVNAVAKQWIDRLKNASAENIAREIYCGRGFREAEASAISLNCPFYIVSAGLGIVNSEQSIPLYCLTVSSGSTNSIRNKASNLTSSKDWWSLITDKNPFGFSLNDTLNCHPEGLILIALPRPYVELLHDELLNIPVHQHHRLRFFGKKLNAILPTTLVMNWMPYDDRLDFYGPRYSGTQADFSQRALRHFVNEVLDKQQDSDTDTHRAMILKHLSPLQKRETPKRQQLSDQEIGIAIHNNWESGKGQSSKLLRIIRSDLGIACEQSRFRNIYHTIKNTIEH